MKHYTPDTSVIIEKLVSKLISKKEIGKSIIIHNATVAELEAQANKGQEIGLLGLEEIQTLQSLFKKNKITLKFLGARPTHNQILHAKSGEIDAMIRDLAFREKAILITADRVQSESAKAYGVDVYFIQTKAPKQKLEIEKLFDNKTMSVHLKENCKALAKKGSPGNWKLVEISKKPYDYKKIQNIAKETVEKSRIDPKAFIEISRASSTIVQYKNHRIVITKPPVSDGWEITAVKPLTKLNI